MSEPKRIVSIKKSSLEGLSHEWGDECYAYITPATYEEMLEVNELNTAELTQREQVNFQLEQVKKHFVSGKIKVFNGTEFELVDMTAEDAVATIAIADKIYADIIGFELDPKDLRKAAQENALQMKSESTTETSSSETSE